MYRIGNSIDIHNLVKSDQMQKLAGKLFLVGYKIIAHSDGDIILHAISEAILGALGLGDLGDYFSDNDDKNKNINSEIILDYALNKLKTYSYQIVNLDISIISELIYFKPIKNDLKLQICQLLNTDNVNIKATRFEKESFQIHCNCAILLKKII